VHWWIKDRLVQCIRSGYNAPGSTTIELEEEIVFELMEIAHQRHSLNDIWAVTAYNISLFQYNTTLATCFFGLNLVRFEHRLGRGRSLQIF
jgi:hypothetical protein